MYACNCNRNGMGAVTDVIGAAASLFGAGGAGGEGMPSSTTVSPQISTQISPQISPNFQQQFQPTNSAMTAGTAQSVPAMPTLGPAASSFPTSGSYTPVSTSPLVPQVPAIPTDYTKYLPWAFLAMAGVLGYKIYRNKSKARK